MARDPKPHRTPKHAQPNLLPNPLERFCTDCGYPLVGLAHDACPECGRGFDPKDPGTYAPTSKPIAVPFDAICAMALATPHAFFLLESWTGQGVRWFWYALMQSDVPWPFLLFALLVFALFGRRGKGHWMSSDRWVALVLVVGLIGFGVAGLSMGLYALCVSCALVIVTWYRAIQTRAWRGRTQATCALGVVALSMFVLVREAPLSTAGFGDYWTYWFWTIQR